MNRVFRISTNFFDRPKTVKLIRRSGLEGAFSLLRLWSFTAQFRPDGILSNMDAEDIEIAAKWSGAAGDLVSALVDVRFLDRLDENTYVVHDWAGKAKGYPRRGRKTGAKSE